MARGKANGSAKAKRGARRSKGEGSTGKKENAAEMRKGGELDLKQVAIDDADFNLHFKAVKNAKERVETANSLYRTCLKNAKKISPDVHDAIKAALTIERMSPEDLKRELEIKGFALKKSGSSIQLTIHDSLMGDVNQAADTAGYRDAKAGRVAKSPYPDGSDLHALYMTGWQRGTRENMGIEADEDVDAGVKGNGIGHNSGQAAEATA